MLATPSLAAAVAFFDSAHVTYVFDPFPGGGYRRNVPSLEAYRFVSSRHGALTAIDGRMMRAAGARLLGRGDALAVVRELLQAAKLGDRKHLAALAGADDGPGLRPRSSTRSLGARVMASLERGRIAFVHGWAPIAQEDQELDVPTTGEVPPEDLLIGRAQPQPEEVALEGRHYLLVPARRWASYRSGGRFEIVRPAEASGVCQRMALRIVSDADRKAAWLEAGEWLGDLRRVPTETEGLFLIRRVLLTAASTTTPSSPAATPSQAKKEAKAASEKELSWIEIAVEDEDGLPFHGTLTLQLPDGRIIHTTPDENGTARFEPIPPGNCKLTFDKLDPRDFEPPAA